ncbi:uncharacterized protein LOC134249898 [Saccostrea cucullata]|uniref:uncharacterized protein LOC134249898 n=1 Tax=Saccostrea cuccullata TaxID=36930 RepID=UPI002ED0D776
MQAQVLTAVVKDMEIIRTINYEQKYITDLKYADNGKVCVSVVNTKENSPSNCELRYGPIQFFSTHGACLCFTHDGYKKNIIFSNNKSLLVYKTPRSKGLPSFWPLPDESLDGYTPTGIGVCKSGAILVSHWNHQMHDRSLGKVFKLSQGVGKLFEIEADKNRPLFICPTYITENGNGDICVSDVNAVVVTDRGGFLRFCYTGAQSDPQFDPYGICCDSMNNIIVADMLKNRIHVINQNGELLHFIQYKDMYMPRSLCIDEHDNLYVGEWSSEEIKVLLLQ